MAYAALLSLAKTIDLIMKYRQDSVPPQIKNQIISINEYVIFLQTFLEHFPDNANSLEARIRRITHIAEVIIEYLLSAILLMSKRFKGQPSRNYEDFTHYFHDLKEVTEKLGSIAEKVMEIKSSITVKDARLGDSTTASSSSRVAEIHKDAMIGFDDDLMDIMSRLCGESSKLEVIPIVGMGGIGKTTLARNAYDHPLIVNHFDICAWVTVSQDSSVQEIISGLLSMKLFRNKNKSSGAHHLYQNLKGRRYLIVLDDIWSEKVWDDLQMMFPDDGNGSRIILTTRLLDVASYANSCSPIHEMRSMDEDQSWNLLRQKVFKRDPCPVELEYVGKMIARSCKGLPLAIVVISGLLAADQTMAAWENIAKDVKSAISANDEQFDKILSLSYTHLPHHLRPCFLYMGGFPEDYEMRVSTLIKLWVAEGFLKPNGCKKSFEETAAECLEDLVKRHLVLVTKKKSDGRIKSLSMHDLMREMCTRKAQEENFILHVRLSFPEDKKIPPRLSCIFHKDPDFPKNVCDSTIRTIIWLKHRWYSSPWNLGCFRLLRILDLSDSHDFTYHDCLPLPDAVFELFHLRYLACNFLLRVPARISNFQNLQTFIIGPRKYYPRVDLPVEIWRMPQLRHLVGIFFLPPFEEGAEVALENLQTLSVATKSIFNPKILKMIPNLKKLGICYMIWKGDEDVPLHNLTYLQQLENLKLAIHSNIPWWEKVKPVLPGTLKKLTLSGLGLPWEDMKIVGSLPNLEVLKLRDHACNGDTWETSEGEFSQLKFLLIQRSDLQHWITEYSHFPRLKRLVLRFCLYLTEIPDGIGEIPTLELIDVNYNGESLVESAKQIQDYQQSCGNDTLQVMACKMWVDD